MNLRRLAARAALGALTVLLCLLPSVAYAEFQGSDVWSNINPDGFAGRYPLGRYALDYSVDTGLGNMDGWPASAAHLIASMCWTLTRFLVTLTISLFAWAFSLDLSGAFTPVEQAVRRMHEHVLGDAFIIAAILALGIWATWRGLAQRRYADAFTQIAVAIAFMLIALTFVYRPGMVIQTASQWTNGLSLAFLGGISRGSLDDPERARTQVSDRLFDTLVYKPWVVLEFGGPSHCVDTHRLNSNDFPSPVAPNDPAANVCRNHLKTGRDGKGGYAPRFLRQTPGSDERKAEYEAIRDGELPVDAPDNGNQFTGWSVDKADAPAVDIQQQGGAFDRLALAALILTAALGAVALLGMLTLSILLASLIAFIWLGFAPVAVLAALVPAFHGFFRSWLMKLLTALFIKCLYSLFLAVVLVVSGALAVATATMGFLVAFGLQAVYFWSLFILRKKIIQTLMPAGAHAPEGVSTGKSEALTGAAVVASAGGAAAAPLTWAWQRHREDTDKRERTQTSVLTDETHDVHDGTEESHRNGAEPVGETREGAAMPTADQGHVVRTQDVAADRVSVTAGTATVTADRYREGESRTTGVPGAAAAHHAEPPASVPGSFPAALERERATQAGEEPRTVPGTGTPPAHVSVPDTNPASPDGFRPEELESTPREELDEVFARARELREAREARERDVPTQETLTGDG